MDSGLVMRHQRTKAATQEAKYVESWPSSTSARVGWSRFDIPVDRYGGVHSLLICISSTVHWGLLPATGLASRKISKSGQDQHSVYSVAATIFYSLSISHCTLMSSAIPPPQKNADSCRTVGPIPYSIVCTSPMSSFPPFQEGY